MKITIEWSKYKWKGEERWAKFFIWLLPKLWHRLGLLGSSGGDVEYRTQLIATVKRNVIDTEIDH